MVIRPIAYIHTDFFERFGIPRQAGLAGDLTARIVFEPEFRKVQALKGIEGFSHLWLIWGFTETHINMEETPVNWSALVTPPRLGGKTKMGVFATRSPYRPNSLGLSSVKLLQVVREGEDAPYLVVGGADILDHTPIYDIKPYVPYTDCHEDAAGGFAVSETSTLQVEFPEELLQTVSEDKRSALLQVLGQDPRGSYEKQPDYVYGLRFAQYDIRFRVDNEKQLLQVFDVKEVGAKSGGLQKIKQKIK